MATIRQESELDQIYFTLMCDLNDILRQYIKDMQRMRQQLEKHFKITKPVKCMDACKVNSNSEKSICFLTSTIMPKTETNNDIINTATSTGNITTILSTNLIITHDIASTTNNNNTNNTAATNNNTDNNNNLECFIYVEEECHLNSCV